MKVDKELNISKIIGVGECSHGSATEFNFKSQLITEFIEKIPSTKLIIFFEGYEEICSEINETLHSKENSVQIKLKRLLLELYNVWQCREVLNFLIRLKQAIEDYEGDVEFIGIDYPNKEVKLGLPIEEIANKRDRLMAENVIKSYDPNCVHFIWSHNSHIGRYGETNNEVIYTPTFTMGHFLNKQFKSKYIPAAQTFIEGEFGARLKEKDEMLEWNTFKLEKPKNLEMLECYGNNISDKLTEYDKLPPDIKYIRNLGYYFNPKNEEKYIIPLSENNFDYYFVHPSSSSSIKF